MSIILNKISNEVVVDGETQTLEYNEPTAQLVIKNNVIPSSEVKTQTAIKFVDGLSRSVILENYAEVATNTTRLKFVNEMGVEQLVFSSTNGDIIFGGNLSFTKLNVLDLLTTNNVEANNISVSNNVMSKTIIATGNMSCENQFVNNITCYDNLTVAKMQQTLVQELPTDNKHIATKEYADLIRENNYLFASLSSSINTNLASGHFIPFNAIRVSQEVNPPYISLDTTSTYSSATNVASVGRITLRAGKSYRISARIFVIANQGAVVFSFFNTDNMTRLGNIPAHILGSLFFSSSSGFSGYGSVLFKPVIDTRIGLRIESGNITGIWGDNNTYTNYIIVEQLD